MTQTPQVKLFESVQVRSHWSEAEERCYFSVVDVVQVLIESINPTDYLKKITQTRPRAWELPRDKLSPGCDAQC